MPKLSPEQWKQASPFLDEALSLNAQERAEWLAVFHQNNPEIAALVELLLDEHRAVAEERFLEQVPPLRPDQSASAGETIGAYSLLSPIGHGGMGTVWLAERSDGRFERKVAIKFPHISVRGHAGEGRFKREGSILARLAHPNVAELVDAGVTPAGQPYLVLEYVDGTQIDTYCDIHKHGIDARIRLFLDVLAAVAHAHTNLIVHRDIKPSNVLVTNEGHVKLLDFGIAKLLEDQSQPAEATILTREAGSVLTPAYAAPEQITGQPITTATDVYSLGVLLYVLLTGRHPTGISQSPAHLVKAIVDIEPLRPSDAITLDQTNPIAANRAATADRLRRRLRGDLDTILVKALKKDSGQRYPSVLALANDLKRHLQREPISARPDTMAYRAAKFVRRNRTAVVLTTIALMAVFIGAGVSIYQASVAQRRFQDVRKLAHTFVFDLHDEIAKLEGSTKAREIMVRTGLEYLDNLSRSAGGDLELQKEIAQAYMKIGDAEGFPTKPNLGHISDAMTSYQKAGDIFRGLAAKKTAYLPDLAKFYLEFSGFPRFSQDLKQARALNDSGLQILERLQASHALDRDSERTYINAWCRIGDIDEDLGDYKKAFSEFSRCGDLARAARRGKDPTMLSILSQADERIGTAARELGLLQLALRALDEDEAAINELLAREPQNPSLHRRSALVHYYRMLVYNDDVTPSYGDPVRALDHAKRYLAATEEMVRRDPRNTQAQFSRAIATYAVSFCLSESDPNAAVSIARNAVRMFDEMIDAGRTDYLTVSRRVRALRRLGETEFKAGRVKDALATARAALETERKIAAQDSNAEEERTLVHLLILTARVNAASGAIKEAETLLSEARESAIKMVKDRQLTNVLPLATVERALGEFYVQQRRNDEARASHQRLSELWQSFPESNDYLDIQRAASNRLLASFH